LGKQLFELSSAAYERGLDPEASLRRYTDTVVQIIENKKKSIS